MPRQFDESVVAGVYMDRSINDFVRGCEVYVQEESQKLCPDAHLIALLCDAVRLSRELTLIAATDSADRSRD